MQIKKYLEYIVEPFKKVDKEILRWYTKKAKKLEEKGKEIKKINLGLSAVYHPIGCALIVLGGSPFLHLYHAGIDSARNVFGRKDIISEVLFKDNLVLETYKVISNFLRLPVITWGVLNTAKGTSDIYNYFFHGQSPNWPETAFNFSTGIEHLALASSIYFKARDPKLLDKEPLWKDTLNKVKNKLEKIISPNPEPVPINSKNNYLKQPVLVQTILATSELFNPEKKIELKFVTFV